MALVPGSDACPHCMHCEVGDRDLLKQKDVVSNVEYPQFVYVNALLGTAKLGTYPDVSRHG